MKPIRATRQKLTLQGVASLELALVFPLVVLTFLALVQIIIYIQASTATQYAAFAAARAFQVYGDRPLSSIDYPFTQGAPYTAAEQSIAEAAAEKVIFESLLWESKRIKVDGDHLSLNRVYEDGIDVTYDGLLTSSKGVVAVNFIGCQGQVGCPQGQGVEVRYCVPIVFPAAKMFFGTTLERWPCKGERLGRSVQGIAIKKTAMLQREPTLL